MKDTISLLFKCLRKMDETDGVPHAGAKPVLLSYRSAFPETRAVIHFPRMSQLVQYDIINQV